MPEKYGIQGGKGSFNEEALLSYAKRNGINKPERVYLYTSDNVLRSLAAGETDRGLIATFNAQGKTVYESDKAKKKYKVGEDLEIVEEFSINISHALMTRKDVELKDVTTIMTHPQVLAQCEKTLWEEYRHLEQTSGEGDLIDHALVAKHLSEGTLPKTTAVMGSKILAKLYDLNIVGEDLQDLGEKNLTTFALIKRL